MSCHQMLQDCDQAIHDLLPDCSRPIQKMLARLVVGVVVSRSGVVRRASVATPGMQQDTSKFRRAQRLLTNQHLDVGRVQRRLVARMLAHGPRDLPLLLDATTTGATRRQGGTVSLVLAVAWHHRAIPVLWTTWATYTPGQEWTAALDRMLATIEALVPPTVPVTVLADRGLTGRPIVACIAAHACHYVLRIKTNAHCRLADGTERVAGALVPAPGTRILAPGIQLWPSRPSSHHAGKAVSWDHALQTHLTGVWPRDRAEPWLIISDLPPALTRCRQYRQRTWEEELFRDLKSMGWQWNRCRVHDPERVARWLVVLALATLWMLALAQRCIRSGARYLVDDRSRRRLSHFHLALAWVDRLRANDRPVPCVLSFYPASAVP